MDNMLLYNYSYCDHRNNERGHFVMFLTLQATYFPG